MQRTIFHIPGLTAARDGLESGDRRAGGLTVRHGRPAHRGSQTQTGAPSWHPGRTTACSTCCGAIAAASWTCRVGDGHRRTIADLADERPPHRGAVHRHPGAQGHPRQGRAAPARSAARQRRPCRARPLYADSHAAVHRRGRVPDDQHPPLISSRVHRSRALSSAPRNAVSNSSAPPRTTCTEDLDEGPIIEQDVVRVDHRHNVDGSDPPGRPTSNGWCCPRRCSWHCEDRIIRYGNQTIVF